MPDPLVSIMMPAYNAAQFIGQAIDSVLAQSYQNWDLIIVDDGSTDDTASIARGYTDLRIRLVSQVNGGESAARNTALVHMRGDLFAFLDADDCYLPQHLAETVSYLNQHMDRDVVYTDGYHIDQEGQRLQSLSSRRRGPFEGWIFPEVVRASDVFGPPMVVVMRRELIDQHALKFDPNIVIGPDWDFLTRFAEFANFGYIDQPTCLYRVHTANISVLTGMQKRRLSLAICREKAIHLSSFEKCSMETRAFVFYDLLINLLTGYPDRQESVTQWKQFHALPEEEQARLLRLMAGNAAALGNIDPINIRRWLVRARQLFPGDIRGVAIETILNLSPPLCSYLLRVRYRSQLTTLDMHPFSDIL
jgi:glycosyltransferase involved in cell wall biosynthesis